MPEHKHPIQVNLRINASLRQRIIRAAKKIKTSVKREIRGRLERSLGIRVKTSKAAGAGASSASTK